MVPVYNVEQYLAECLDSILGQDFTDIEVVVVDDGSTDGSAAIARGYARRHHAVSLVSNVNQGLGAARNLGVSNSRGRFLTFVDSDDLVLPNGYSVMMATLEESGSDFVAGSMQRLFDGELTEPAFLQRLHRQRRLRLHIDDKPEMISNSYAWNKIFRRSFWDRAGMAFPTGVRYEDQVAMTEVYLRGETFDIVRRPVYAWRIRDDGSSITQRRYELDDLEDRLVTKRMTTEVVTTLGSPQVRQFWLTHGLGGDLPLYFRHIPGCSDAYWERLVTGVTEIYAGYPPIEASELIRVQHRLVGWLVTHDRRHEAVTIQRWLEQRSGSLPLETRDGHVVARLPFHDDPGSGIPAELFWLADHELAFDARLWHVAAEQDDVVVRGAAVVRGAPTSGVGCTIDVVLHCDDAQLPMSVRSCPSPEVSHWVNRAPQRYDEGGFQARVPISLLSNHARAGRRWQLLMSVDVGGISRSGPFRSKQPGVEIPGSLTGPDGTVIRVTVQRDSGLLLEPSLEATRRLRGGAPSPA